MLSLSDAQLCTAFSSNKIFTFSFYDRKRLQRLREKKMALGHKWNDHEEQQSHNMRGL